MIKYILSSILLFFTFSLVFPSVNNSEQYDFLGTVNFDPTGDRCQFLPANVFHFYKGILIKSNGVSIKINRIDILYYSNETEQIKKNIVFLKRMLTKKIIFKNGAGQIKRIDLYYHKLYRHLHGKVEILFYGIKDAEGF